MLHFRLKFAVYNKLDRPIHSVLMGDYSDFLKSTGHSIPNTFEEIQECPPYKNAKKAVSLLAQRQLVELAYRQKPKVEGPNECCSLTLEGYDLASKYNNWFTRWGLWWQEHRVNPIWLIIGFIITYLAGIASAVLIDKLTSP